LLKRKNVYFEFQDEIHVEENVPWGEDTLFTLEFREEEHKYAVHTCTNMYLQKDGKLSPAINKVRNLTFSKNKVITKIICAIYHTINLGLIKG
jgi:hypothetical protein